MLKEDECPEEYTKSSTKIKYSGYLDGVVKWVDNKRGFGFIEVDYKGKMQDAFVHISLMKDNKPLPDLTPVKCIVAETNDGLKVIALRCSLDEMKDEEE